MSVKSNVSRQKSTSGSHRSWFDALSPMKKDLFCIAILFALMYILFFKIITSDMMFSDSGDTAAAHSWSKAVEYLKDKEQVDPIWVPYIFSGMPIAGALMFPREVNYAERMMQGVGNLFFLNGVMSWMILHYFLMGVFMYLLARQMKFSHLPSLFAGIVFMLNPYAIGLGQSGHGTKLMTLTFVPLVFLLAYSLFQKRNILSLGLLAAATGTMLMNKHPQIAFYGLLAIGCYFLYESILDVKKTPVLVLKKALLLGIALAIGFVIYLYQFLPTQEYQAYSIRSGLSYEYATNWSFHPLESFTFVLPSFFGFSTPYVTEFRGQESQFPLYWGWLPFTDGPVYLGIITVLLVIVAIIYKRNRATWFFIIFSVFVLFMSFGSHFSLVYNIFFNYFPYFDKWRAPQMILYLLPMTFGILAAYGMTFLLGLNERVKEFDTAKLKKRLLTILGIVGGTIVLGFIAKGTLNDFLSGFMFSNAGEVQQYGQQMISATKEVRFEVFFSDVIKMLVFAGAFFGLIIYFLNRKISSTTAAFGMVLLLTLDLFIVDVRFINPKPRGSVDQALQPDATVKFLQTDTTLYRTFPVGELFQDNTLMYHYVSSIGGYSPAKLKIYQELIESLLYGGTDPQFPLNMNVVNMLNVKYLIAQGRLPEDRFTFVNVDEGKKTLTYMNPNALPRAWFVDAATVETSKTKIFALMNSPLWNPRTTAILEKALAQQCSKADSSSVSVTSYQSQSMTFRATTVNQALLVVSEVYYPAIWKAYIDGTETEIYKTNYVLRSVIVPPGTHTIEFRTDASVYNTGLSMTYGGWILSSLLIVFGLIQVPSVRKRIGLKAKEAVSDGQKVTSGS